MKKPIYLDGHATTPTDPRVIEVMIPLMWEHFGNSSSASHQYGWHAAEVVTIAREQVAALIGAKPDEIIFTSSATESNNLTLFGVAYALAQRRQQFELITTAIEHRSILDPATQLRERGYPIHLLEVSRSGLVDRDALEELLSSQSRLVSLIYGHNEIGTLNDLPNLASLLKCRGVLLHSDATQAVGKIPLSVDALGVDFLSLSAHKLYGPKGVGALYVRKSAQAHLHPLLFGGGQELGLRSGTLNVPGIAGLGKACELAMNEMHTEVERLHLFTKRFLKVLEPLGGVTLNGAEAPRLPGSLNLRIEGVESASLIGETQSSLAFSVGSACQSTAHSPSHVLQALGLSDDEQRQSFRLCFGRFTTHEDVELAASILCKSVQKLRAR